MKKFAYSFLAAVLAFTMTACTNNQPDVTISIPDGTDINSLRVSYERENLIQLLKITEGGVNIRNAESFDDSSIITQSQGVEYYVLLQKGEAWNKINYNGSVAFVHESYSEISSMLASDAQDYIDGKMNPPEDTSSEESSTDDTSSGEESSDDTSSEESSDDTSSEDPSSSESSTEE